MPCVPTEPSQHPRRFSLRTLELLESFFSTFPWTNNCDVDPAVDSEEGRSGDLLASRPSPPEVEVAEKCPGKRSGSSFFRSGDACWARQRDSDRYENSYAQLV